MTLGIDGWKVGQTLSSSLTTFLRSNTPGSPTPVTVTFRGLEAVTVEAGTFRDSMKIDFSLVIDDPSFPFSITKTQWYARGVGLVKSVQPLFLVGGGTSTFTGLYETWELTDHGTLSSPPPQLLGISPSVGPVEGPTEVTLTGDFFSSGAQVTFGLRSAGPVTVESSTVIKAVIPSGPIDTISPGLVDVTVVNTDCQVSILEDAFTFQ